MKFFTQLGSLIATPDNVSIAEKLIAASCCFIAILVTAWLDQRLVSGQAYPILVASMGASAILLFAVPHGPFSQPWSFAGGQIISALTGISCLFLIPDTILAAATAVGMAALLMYVLRCLHPPGGATALAAVLGGSEMAELGYQFALTPVALNALFLLLMALMLNNLLPGRHYPFSTELEAEEEEPVNTDIGINHESLQAALQQIDKFVDVSEEELAEIYALAQEYQATKKP